MENKNIPVIFDYQIIRNHRARAAQNFSHHDFLFREMAERLCERLEYIRRDFPQALDLGAKTGIIAQTLAGRGSIKHLVQLEQSPALLANAQGTKLIASEEMLPFADNSFDLVISAGSLHTVNDLAGTLVQVRRILKPDGLFLAVVFGGETLKELRASFEQAEMTAKGGMSPRVFPFIDVQTGGQLLQRAGFLLPVVDKELITVEYEHPLKLMKELRGMGEANALHDRIKYFTPCSLIMSAVDNYFRDFPSEDGGITASFEFITLTGWKQAKPGNNI